MGDAMMILCQLRCFQAIGNNWVVIVFFSSRRRHTRYWRDWSSDVCSSDLCAPVHEVRQAALLERAGEVARLDVVLDDEEHDLARVTGEELPDRPERAVEREQIGRASCRERV